jgi:hypothetical protein
LCSPDNIQTDCKEGHMNIASFIALALFLLEPGATRDFRVQASGQSVRIQAQMPRRFLGEPLRIDDGTGRTACYDDTGELTVKCVDKFYGTAITAKFHFDGNGVMTDTIRSIASHPEVLPIPTTTRTVQTVGKEAVAYRIFGYDESGMTTAEVEHFRKLQAPFWLEIREDIALDDKPVVSLYWRQTLNAVELERIESH